MELYYIIAITDHDRGEAMGSLYHAAGLHLILSMPARGRQARCRFRWGRKRRNSRR